MRPEDVHTPEDYARYLEQQRAELARAYATPPWERVLLFVVLVALAVVVASGVVTAVRA